MDADVAAAILAGGRARRFGGRDKSRLLVQGRSIINRQMDVLQQVTDQIFVIAPDAGPFADLGVQVRPDAIPGAGALGGIYTALEAASRDCVLTVACDQPFLEARLLLRLVDLSSGHDGAWVRTPRGPEPLLACYRRASRHAIRRQIAARQLKAADLGSVLDMAALDSTELERFGPPERLLANVNTAQDYEKLARG